MPYISTVDQYHRSLGHLVIVELLTWVLEIQLSWSPLEVFVTLRASKQLRTPPNWSPNEGNMAQTKKTGTCPTRPVCYYCIFADSCSIQDARSFLSVLDWNPTLTRSNQSKHSPICFPIYPRPQPSRLLQGNSKTIYFLVSTEPKVNVILRWDYVILLF